MKLTKLVIMIIVMGGITLLSPCNADIPKNSEPVFDNEVPFVYDEYSKLTMDSFSGMTTMTELIVKYPMGSIRENEGKYYTVYSLKDKKLAYVIFFYSPDTGITFFINDIVEYPYSSSVQKEELYFLLPQDLPEEILK